MLLLGLHSIVGLISFFWHPRHRNNEWHEDCYCTILRLLHFPPHQGVSSMYCTARLQYYCFKNNNNNTVAEGEGNCQWTIFRKIIKTYESYIELNFQWASRVHCGVVYYKPYNGELTGGKSTREICFQDSFLVNTLRKGQYFQCVLLSGWRHYHHQADQSIVQLG